jgi:DNA-binding MarR family transcriptional regulator
MMEQKSLSEIVRNEVYKKLDELKLSNAQLRVLDVIERHHPGGIHDKYIAKATGMPITSVCGRRNELIKAGIVEAVGWDLVPDYKGEMHKNTLWGLKGS